MIRTLTTEQLREIMCVYGNTHPCYLAAAECLANREAQPVATVLFSPHGVNVSTIDVTLPDGTKLYTAPPAPAVSDDYQHLKNVRELYHKQEDRLFSLAQRIKGASFDKYSHVPSQAIDVLEREIFGDDGDACRAAMLAAAPEGGNEK